MKELVSEKVKESFTSVLPITLIVLIISLFSNDSNLFNLIPAFLIGSLLIVIGISIFDIGANISMVKMGSCIGKHITKKKKVLFILFMCFIVATIITMAEPDLLVLSGQIPNISKLIVILSVSVGVGIFFTLASFRVLKKWNYNILLISTCLTMFLIVLFVPAEFIGVAFDSGGVTTGALSVPFIISLSRGISEFRTDKGRKDDSFGLMAFCTIGPIIILLLLGIIYKSNSASRNIALLSTADILTSYLVAIPKYLKEIALSLSPIIILFIIYNFLFLKLKKKNLLKIFKGLLYTYIGLVIFMIGVNVGFLPASYLLGSVLANNIAILLPISALLGFFIIFSEPAVKVLLDQIENITNGTINRKLLFISLSLGVSIATLLSIARIVFGFSILYILIPSYVIAILLSFFIPTVFTRIAFDSGGVASGTMTASFLLPLSIGVATFLGKDILVYSFGLVAIIATIPVITIEIIGLIYKIKSKKEFKTQVYNAEIIDYY